MIYYEKEIISHLKLPNIPKKKWDGKSSFKYGVGIIKLTNSDDCAYAVVTYDANVDEKPRVCKVFSLEPYHAIDDIFVVPNYMDNDVEHFDMDDDSKKAAEELLKEAEELEMEGVERNITLPDNEYCFDFIHNDEEAVAYLRSYYKDHTIRNRVPTKHDTIVARLAAIYAESQLNNN